MDKIIEKKTGWRVAFTKKALPWWLGALLLAFVIYLIARPNNKTLRVDKDTVTISSAVKGEFNDYIRISGRVQPMPKQLLAAAHFSHRFANCICLGGGEGAKGCIVTLHSLPVLYLQQQAILLLLR